MPEPAPSPFARVAAGVQVRIRLTPRAGADRIGEVMVDDAGAALLKVYVTAVPEDGRANAALVKLLARAWKLPRTAIDIASGQTGRRKTLIIRGAAEDVMARLASTRLTPRGKPAT